MTFGPHILSSGPPNANIFLLAEAPGSEESEKLQPFVGPSGHELRRMLRTVGIDLNECRKAHVFSRQPANNNLALYGDPDLRHCLRNLGPLTNNPIVYCAEQYLHELDRVHDEIAQCEPNIIIALGPAATWALGLGTGISALRGSIHTTSIPNLPRAVKVLPTFKPEMILRQWDQRVIAIADLQKAHANSHSPAFTFDNSELWLAPTLEDILAFDRAHMVNATICAADIETKRGQITCISFAPTTAVSLVIPFWQEGPVPAYWATPEEECIAWRYVQMWMERADLTKVFQNGLYDLAYLQSYCTPRACTEDTMLAHHSLYSELQKGLGFLGSIYCDAPSWKRMRTFRKEEQLKKDD